MQRYNETSPCYGGCFTTDILIVYEQATSAVTAGPLVSFFPLLLFIVRGRGGTTESPEQIVVVAECASTQIDVFTTAKLAVYAFSFFPQRLHEC